MMNDVTFGDLDLDLALDLGRRPASLTARAILLALLLAVVWALTGCGSEADPLAPPEIRYGEDICDACQMIISDPRFAAATLVEVDGATEPRRFDDIGDLLAYHREDPELVVRAWYVHDYDSEAWLDARRAHFVRAEGIRSPMGFGLAAFAEPERAEAFATEMEGEVLDFETLLGRPPGGSTASESPEGSP